MPLAVPVGVGLFAAWSANSCARANGARPPTRAHHFMPQRILQQPPTPPPERRERGKRAPDAAWPTAKRNLSAPRSHRAPGSQAVLNAGRAPARQSRKSGECDCHVCERRRHGSGADPIVRWIVPTADSTFRRKQADLVQENSLRPPPGPVGTKPGGDGGARSIEPRPSHRSKDPRRRRASTEAARTK